jgi:hypothetical protein
MGFFALETKEYHADGSYTVRTDQPSDASYTYNADGSLREHSEIGWAGRNIPGVSPTRYTYDGDGNLINTQPVSLKGSEGSRKVEAEQSIPPVASVQETITYVAPQKNISDNSSFGDYEYGTSRNNTHPSSFGGVIVFIVLVVITITAIVIWSKSDTAVSPPPIVRPSPYTAQPVLPPQAVAPGDPGQAPAPSAGFSDWMTSDRYQNYFDQMKALGRFPVIVEGRSTNGIRQFRGNFIPIEPRVSYWSHHNASPALIAERTAELASQGYVLSYRQASQDAQGMYVQAVWIRRPAPAPQQNAMPSAPSATESRGPGPGTGGLY